MNDLTTATANGWPADGVALLDELAAFIRRYVVMSEAQAAVVALWIVHSYAIAAADTTPYLHISSPTKRSGKSRLLDVLEVLVRKPLKAGGATEAALFRGIADRTPTLLFDEIDSVFGPKAREHEDLRALLNNGYRRGTPVLRCVGEGTRQKAAEFDVFCVKALCGIGRLPDTLADRALPIVLKRKARRETVERFRYKQAHAAAAGLRERAEGWAELHLERLAEAEPELPDELDDRAQDVSEPLLAIADLAGGDWPARARRALLAVRGGANQELHDDDAGVRLLADIQSALGDGDRISTEDLIAALIADKEAPWATWHRGGNPISARALAGLLRGFEVRSRTIRLEDRTTPKGYLADQFRDLFSRYLPENASPSATPPQPAWLSQKEAKSIRHTETAVADEKLLFPAWINECGGVAETMDQNRGDGDAGTMDCGHECPWTARDGKHRCLVCEPPAFPAEVVA